MYEMQIFLNEFHESLKITELNVGYFNFILKLFRG